LRATDNNSIQRVKLNKSRAIAGSTRDAVVNFDTHQILQRHRVVSLPQRGFLVGLCLQTAVNYLLKSDKY